MEDALRLQILLTGFEGGVARATPEQDSQVDASKMRGFFVWGQYSEDMACIVPEDADWYGQQPQEENHLLEIQPEVELVLGANSLCTEGFQGGRHSLIDGISRHVRCHNGQRH